MTKQLTLIVDISMHELALRIAEGCLGMKRPMGVSADEGLAYFPEDARQGFERAAQKAADYIAECIQNGQRPQ